MHPWTAALLSLGLGAWACWSVDAAERPTFRLTAQVEPAEATAGAVVEFRLTIDLPPGWITYDQVQAPGGPEPTAILLDPSPHYTPMGEVRSPPAIEELDANFGNHPVRYFTRSPTFTRRLVLDQDLGADGLQIVPIRGRVDFMLFDLASGRRVNVRKYPFETVVRVLPNQDAARRQAAVAKKEEASRQDLPSTDRVRTSQAASAAGQTVGMEPSRPVQSPQVEIHLGDEPELTTSGRPTIARQYAVWLAILAAVGLVVIVFWRRV